MPFTQTMPKLSPTMEEGTIAKWHKKVGDLVKAGDVIFEIVTDKSTVEHAALDSGYLRQILVKDGESAVVNQPLAIFTETLQESIEGYKPEGAAPKKAEAAAPTPQPTEDSKATTPVATPKPVAGGMMQPAFVPEPPLEKYTFTLPDGLAPERIFASPLARKMAKEKGLDLSTVKGSGPHGRILSEDLDLAQPGGLVAFGSRARPSMAPGSYEEETLSPIRKVIAQRLQDSKTFIPHFYVTQEVRADRLVSLHQDLKANAIKVSFNDFIVRACALALKEHPGINSGFNSVNKTILRFKTVDIAVAVSVDAGLITPIVRHADYKNLGEISVEVKALAQKARQGKLSKEEYMGGSFTVSNLGMYGVTDFVGVINPPQAALLAVGGIEDRAVVEGDKIVIGKTMRLTLSVDHRVIDGAEAAKFIKALQKLLESPSVLLV
jgi:pyruvate dehydrogenase E2 component (dihydrolipoamide acetyltransferase)